MHRDETTGPPLTERAHIDRRAVLMRRSDADPGDIEHLTVQHGLEIVHTAFVDTDSAYLSVLIGGEHVLNFGVDVIVIPHLTEEAVQADRSWRMLTGLVEVITIEGVLAWDPVIIREPQR